MAEQPKVSATFKAHEGYNAPWLVVEGADPGDLALRLQAIEQVGLPGLVSGVNEAFQSLFAVAPITQQPAPAQSNPYAGGSAAPAQAPAASSQPAQSSGPAPTCNHGPRVYSEWFAKNNPSKQFKAWKCPNDTGKNAVDKCNPQWVD